MSLPMINKLIIHSIWIDFLLYIKYIDAQKNAWNKNANTNSDNNKIS